MRTRNAIAIAATSQLNRVDPALIRSGRFDSMIHLQPPSESDRLLFLSQLPLLAHLNLVPIAKKTTGFVAADLIALYEESCRLAMESDVSVTQAAIESALQSVRPALLRSSTLNIEYLTWSNIGGLDLVKKKLQQYIEWPFKFPQKFMQMGLEPIKGILLYGPPGCSKTTIAKVIASVSNSAFFTMSGSNMYSSMVGESEANIRTMFKTASASSPSIIFLDEVECLVGKRSSSTDGDPVQERILSTLLNEMDGIENIKNVIVLGATNRPDLIDDALLRPGRFDKIIHVCLR
jgi:transitional endoplasmic reticulum ATPase